MAQFRHVRAVFLVVTLGFLAMLVTHAGVGLPVQLGASVAAQAAVPTFNADIAPMLYSQCITCHRPGGIAPMPLVTYEQTKAFASAIRQKVTAREMPPWYAEGPLEQFKNARGLTSAQIDTLSRWAEGGAPEGTGSLPAAPTFPESGWSPRMDRKPDLVLDLPFGEYETPMFGEVPTFTVWMKLPLREDRFVQAIEVRPSLPHAVHHSSLALAPLPAGTRIGKAAVFDGGPVLDGVPMYNDGRPFRASSGDEFGRPIMFYVPGGGFLQFPNGYAKRFRQNDYLAWGLHLISSGKVEKLRVQVGIWYARGNPHHEVQTWTVNEKLIFDGKELVADANGGRRMPSIPPGVSNLAVTGELKIVDDITIYSLWPHMHYRGKDMMFVLTEPNGKKTTLLNVPHYNPHWQITYELAKPLKVKRGSIITAFGHYDNSSANPNNPDPRAEVKFGPQGTDEMYIPFLEVSVDREDLRFDVQR